MAAVPISEPADLIEFPTFKLTWREHATLWIVAHIIGAFDRATEFVEEHPYGTLALAVAWIAGVIAATIHLYRLLTHTF